MRLVEQKRLHPQQSCMNRSIKTECGFESRTIHTIECCCNDRYCWNGRLMFDEWSDDKFQFNDWMSEYFETIENLDYGWCTESVCQLHRSAASWHSPYRHLSHFMNVHSHLKSDNGIDLNFLQQRFSQNSKHYWTFSKSVFSVIVETTEWK
jgi:hypothetical protein